MKFNFKIQQYQTDAVEAVARVFAGQGLHEKVGYRRDVGKTKKMLDFEGNEMDVGIQMKSRLDEDEADLLSDTGYKNELVELSDEQLLQNIQQLQNENNIKMSNSLVKALGRCSLDIEMETGTGKTYVYIKTMFELNKRYGWSKFIVVVPSIAIREGVKKSFEITADHFMEHYGKKARFFIYNSSNLNQLDNFSSSSGINVMIINTQAFASSLKEDGKSKEARIIYSKRDEFGSRRPIDVIKANRPIIILDEPQKMGGDVTQKALKNFNPLFSLNYSATHKTQHNLVYVLDALDAFNKRLVKKIEVKGFEVKNLRGVNGYLYAQEIVLSKNKPPMVRLEFEQKLKTLPNPKRIVKIVGVDDSVYSLSNDMEQYKGYTISEIDPIRGTVTFTNGEVISVGDVVGDVSEKDMRRIQIRETILSHFEKEEKLYNKGIKTLSLFFIDEVAKYRQYDENGDEVLGEYGKMFEEEYLSVLNEHLTMFDDAYQKYLRTTCDDISAIHRGYFSIDKKTGRSIDSALKKGSEFSDDISAYDLILKNKERLLSFEEPTRFIFSHSALREGWDNPNVFQICTLKHSDSNTAKRQEVGRGLRLCVNQAGNRMDAETCGDTVHDVNVLTVIASESYKSFVSDLQSDIKEMLYDRPLAATSEYFKGKFVKADGVQTVIDTQTANIIEGYLLANGYSDYIDRKITDKYRSDMAAGTLAPLPPQLAPMAEYVHKLVQAVFDESILKDMVTDGHETKVKDNPLNDNFYKKEFQTLWNYINHKYAYTVEFDSEELIKKAVAHINDKLFVSELQYTTSIGQQKSEMNEHEVDRGDSFKTAKTRTQTLKHAETSRVTSTEDYPDEFLPLAIKRLGEDIKFCDELITKNPQYPYGMSTFITKALELDLIKEAQIIFTAVAMNTHAKVKDMENLISTIIMDCSNWEELETIEKFKYNILPIIKKMNSKRIQRLYPKFENDVDEYIRSVESSEEKYQYSRRFKWRVKYKELPLYDIDPLDYESEADYLKAAEQKKYAWRRYQYEARRYGIDVNAFETEDEYKVVLNQKREEAVKARNEERAKAKPKPTVDPLAATDKAVYNFCSVIFNASNQPYTYLVGELDIKIGDKVVVPVGNDNTERVATVVSTSQHMRLTAPFHVDKAKKVIRKVEE